MDQKVLLLLFSMCSSSTDTATSENGGASYDPDQPCGPEIWQIECTGCIDGLVKYDTVVVLCELSSNPQLDALELTFDDFRVWREENPEPDLTLIQDDHLEVDWDRWVDVGPRY